MRTYIPLMAATAILAVSCQNKPDYDATGIFEATTVTVSAETSGKILFMNFSEGDSLMQGQEVALVDTVLLSLQSKQTQSRKVATEATSPDIAAQLNSLRAKIAHQKNEVKRFERLLAEGATTRKTYDDNLAQLWILEGELRAMQSTLDKNKSSISGNVSSIGYQEENISEQIARAHIKAPITGTVLTKYAEPGEYATPGKPLFKMANLNGIYLRSYFTASQLANVKIGQKVTVIADFGGDEQFEYPGTVTWIAEESEFTPKSIQTRDSRANLVYAVKVAIKNDGRLKIGQYGEVRL